MVCATAAKPLVSYSCFCFACRPGSIRLIEASCLCPVCTDTACCRACLSVLHICHALLALWQVYTLGQFADSHAQHNHACAAKLEEFSEAVYDTVEGACKDALIQLQQHLESLTVKAADSEAGNEGSSTLGHSMSGGPGPASGASVLGNAAAGISSSMSGNTQRLTSTVGAKNSDSRPQQQVGQ